jgi:hypothetical protein
MIDSETPIAAIWMLLLAPVIPIAWGWFIQLRRSRSGQPQNFVLLTVATASFAIFWLQDTPDYSPQRFALIYANLATVALALVAGVFPKLRSWPASLSLLVLLVDWVYLLTVSAAV